MKLFNKYLTLLFALAVVFASCEDAPDTIIESGTSAAILSLGGSSGALYGTFDANGDLAIIQNELALNVAVSEGADQISEFVVKKSFNGGAEVEVMRSSTAPFSYAISTVADFNSTVNSSGALILGDAFTFKVYTVLNNGMEVVGASSSITISVLCPSDLAGMYSVATVRAEDGATFQWDEEIFETGPGEYRTESVGRWGPNGLGYTPGFTFTDLCNAITVPEQNLVDAYSNLVFPVEDVFSYSTPAEGKLHIAHAVGFSDNTVFETYISDYTKK